MRFKVLPPELRYYRTSGVAIHHFSLAVSTFNDVAEFMNAAGHLPSAFGYALIYPYPAIVKLYMSFIEEEYKETQEAFKKWSDHATAENLAELVDGLFDLQWVTKGCSLALGLPQRLIWTEGAYSNLSKIDAETGKLTKREDGKVLKPEGWQKPDFLGIVKDTREKFT